MPSCESNRTRAARPSGSFQTVRLGIIRNCGGGTTAAGAVRQANEGAIGRILTPCWPRVADLEYDAEIQSQLPGFSLRPMHDAIPLQLLANGQAGAIAAVVGKCESVHRLHEMGLREGAEVEMIQPGSPCIIRLGEHRLCMRADDLVSVLVRVGCQPNVAPSLGATQ